MRKAVDDLGQTIVMVTHDPIAAGYADRVVFLADGKIVDELLEPTADSVLDQHEEPGRVSPHVEGHAQGHPRAQGPLPAHRLAVMLGVAFMSGTLVLTETISKTFDDLFANIYEGTDAVVRSARSRSTSSFGGQEQRSRIARDLARRRSQAPTASRPPTATCRVYALIVDRDGDAHRQPETGRADARLRLGRRSRR